MAWTAGTATIQAKVWLSSTNAVTLGDVGVFSTPTNPLDQDPLSAYYYVGDAPPGDTINALPGANPDGEVFEIVSITNAGFTGATGGGLNEYACDVEVNYPARYAVSGGQITPGHLFNVVVFGTQSGVGNIRLHGGVWPVTLTGGVLSPPTPPAGTGTITSSRSGASWSLTNTTTSTFGSVVDWAWQVWALRPGAYLTVPQIQERNVAQDFNSYTTQDGNNAQTYTLEARSNVFNAAGYAWDEAGYIYLSNTITINAAGLFADGTHDPHGDLYAVGAATYGAPGDAMPDAVLRVFDGGLSANVHEISTAFEAGDFYGTSAPLVWLHGALYLLSGTGSITTLSGAYPASTLKKETFSWNLRRSNDAGEAWEDLAADVWAGPYDGAALVAMPNGAGWGSAIVRLKDNGLQARDEADTANENAAAILFKHAYAPDTWPADEDAVEVAELDDSTFSGLAPLSPLSLLSETHDGNSRLWITDGVSGAWRSLDYGSTWQSVTFTAPFESADWVRVTALYGGRFVAVDRTGNMALSFDGMATWEALPGTAWPVGEGYAAILEQLRHARSARWALFNGVDAVKVSDSDGATWADN